MKRAMLMGKLANGAQRDHGKAVHLVPESTGQYGMAQALCGTEPGRTSGGWNVEAAVNKQTTCLRCLERERTILKRRRANEAKTEARA